MKLVIAALRTGHDPIGKLPEAGFHTLLDQQILCPKCSATYNLICDYEASIGRHFEEESRRAIMLLRKAVMIGHYDGHRVSHFESAGVVVTRFLSQGAEAIQPRGSRGGSPAPQTRDSTPRES